MSNKIDIVHTPCKKCVFAIFDGDTQKGCFLNKIEKFKAKGFEILEVYDNEKEFYVINKKKCLSYRESDWLQKRNCSNLDDASKVLQDENTMKYIAVIYLEENTTKEEFETIISSLMQQKIPPKGLMIVRDKYKEYHLNIKDITPILNGSGIHWRLQNFIDETMTYDQKIKAIIKSAPIDRFYYLVYPSKYLINNFAEKIDNAIQDGTTFGCVNINGNLFFSYLTMLYAQNLTGSNLLEQTDMHTNYETIN